jgi:hypothetical protein
MSLRKTIRQLIQASPNITTQEIFDRVRPQFPNDNVVWMKKYIGNERTKFRTKSVKEKAFLSWQTEV